MLSAHYEEPDSAGFYIVMEKLDIKDLNLTCFIFNGPG